MPASGIKLVDANVWLASAFSDHQHYIKAKEWFDTQAERSCAFCRVTQLALLRHLTNSKIMGKFVQSQQSAWQTYDQLAGYPRLLRTNSGQMRIWRHLPKQANRKWCPSIKVSSGSKILNCFCLVDQY